MRLDEQARSESYVNAHHADTSETMTSYRQRASAGTHNFLGFRDRLCAVLRVLRTATALQWREEGEEEEGRGGGRRQERGEWEKAEHRVPLRA